MIIVQRKNDKFITTQFLSPIGKVFDGKFLTAKSNILAQQQYQDDAAVNMKLQMLLSKIKETSENEDVTEEYKKEFDQLLSNSQKKKRFNIKQEKFRVVGYENNHTILEFAYQHEKKLIKFGFTESE